MKRKSLYDGSFFLRTFWFIINISFLTWLIFLTYNPQGSQLNLFFERMQNFWADATNVTGMVADNNPYFSEAKGSYPPLAYMFFFPLVLVSNPPMMLYSNGIPYLLYYYQPLWTFYFLIALLSFLVLLYKISVSQFKNISDFDRTMIGLSFCLSYPVLYTVERGNILLIAVLAISVFIFYYDSDCKWKKEIALISFAVAVALKVSPVIFGVLLILNKDWKSLTRTVCYSLILFLLPFFFFEGGIHNLTQLSKNVNLFIKGYVSISNSMGTGLVASYIKYVQVFLSDNYQITFNIFSYIRILTYIVSFILFLGVFHFQEKWKVVFNITLILLILPIVSLTYCVIYMIPTTILFLKSCKDDKNRVFPIDKIVIFICLIMIYFVYRCPITDFFNYNFAIPILTYIGVVYSIQEFVKSKRLLSKVL